MSRFFVLHESYAPNTASTIRLNGLLKELSARGITTNVLFFIGDANWSEAPELPNIRYEYYWKWCRIRNSKFQVLLFLFVYSFLFYFRVRSGDTVYLDRCDQLVSLLVRKKDVRVFQERTEHPEVSHLGLVNLKKYFRTCKKLTGLFVISTNLKKLYVSKGVDESKIHIINMTVDQSRFEKLKKDDSAERYIAYCGSSMLSKDGLDQLLLAFSYLIKEYRQLKLYVIGGFSKKGVEPFILHMIESLNISDNVVFTGIVPSFKMPQILKNANLLALARPDNKQARYGFPTKLGEYLLTGNPVVVTAVGDIPLFLEDGKSAFIAQPDNPRDFADKMLFALGNFSLSRKVGQRGQQVALEHFNSKLEAKKLIEVVFPE